jgi:hypothetical protein
VRGARFTCARAHKRRAPRAPCLRVPTGVVLRVDSPGGDALASDLMWREICKLAEKKPVVACMGDVAASGGYYMSMAAQVGGSTCMGRCCVLCCQPMALPCVRAWAAWLLHMCMAAQAGWVFAGACVRVCVCVCVCMRCKVRLCHRAHHAVCRAAAILPVAPTPRTPPSPARKHARTHARTRARSRAGHCGGPADGHGLHWRGDWQVQPRAAV